MGIKSTTLYVGGAFNNIGGSFKPHFAAFSTSSGNLVHDVSTTNSTVYSISVKGDTLFLGGSFTTLGFQNERIAALTTTVDIPAHDFSIANGTVRCIIPDGSGGWFVGGSFNYYRRRVAV
jgi:hypothetical protein